MVYDDAEAIFSEIRKSGDALFEDAIKVLIPSSTSLSSLSNTSESADLIGLNTTFFPRRDIVQIPKGALGALKSVAKESEVQELRDGSGAYVVMDGREGQGVVKPIGKDDEALVNGLATGVSGESAFLRYPG